MHRFLALLALAVSLTVAASQSGLAGDTAALVLDGDLLKPMSWTLCGSQAIAAPLGENQK